ncbi:Alpha/Beta hydrolase protein [Xylaria sp. FL1042]|nr:Alpha/Beta hydrolase protein [Xylaria sp. FL1042]
MAKTYIMLPRPSLSFTLPSIYDGTKLDCRVYHPPSFHNSSYRGGPWVGHAAVIAHPYAPLGGCFDDPIVDVTAGTILQLEFLVATFNFRGAGSSEGRTSWTSKPEQADYMSVVGFLAYYARHLDLSLNPYHANQHHLRIMLLAGYSYGAMVVTRLPPLDTILSYFATPAVHTAEAEIRLRAQHLAETPNPQSTLPLQPLDVPLDGNEDSLGKSHDGSNSPLSGSRRAEQIGEDVRNLLSLAKLVCRKSSHWSCQREVENKMHHCLENFERGVVFRSAYLAVSPPVGLVTRLTTLSFSSPLPSPWVRRSTPTTQAVPVADETPLASNPTLVIYGERDGFISYGKMREWTRQLSGADASEFHHVEVAKAGHFWTENDVVYQLRDAICTFVTKLTRLRASSPPTLRMG